MQEGTSAEPTGTNAGGSAGTQASYVLEVRSSGRNPGQAKAVTDAVADQLVALSNDRFKRDAEQNVAGLQTQVDDAAEVAKTKTLAVANFQTKNGISAVRRQAEAVGQHPGGSAPDLMKARADLADTRAQLASVEALARPACPAEESSKQTIVTGRSTTETEHRRDQLGLQRAADQAEHRQAAERGYQARIDRLTRQLVDGRAAGQERADRRAGRAAAVGRPGHRQRQGPDRRCRRRGPPRPRARSISAGSTRRPSRPIRPSPSATSTSRSVC